MSDIPVFDEATAPVLPDGWSWSAEGRSYMSMVHTGGTKIRCEDCRRDGEWTRQLVWYGATAYGAIPDDEADPCAYALAAREADEVYVRAVLARHGVTP